jgi:uncharacterized membrane protein
MICGYKYGLQLLKDRALDLVAQNWDEIGQSVEFKLLMETNSAFASQLFGEILAKSKK